jgi:hypothetical protein
MRKAALSLALLLCGIANASGRSVLIVAGHDAPPEIKEDADYVCDYNDDQVEIQAAIERFYSDPCFPGGMGGSVDLCKGTFSISSAIAMRNRVSLIGGDAVHGTIITIANGANCHGVEIADREGKGQTNIKGIYVEGNKANQTGGSGFVMPQYGIRVTNSGAGASTSTVEVTSTQIIFRKNGAVDYAITLSTSLGTLISDVINVVNGNNGWTVTNATGGLPGVVKTSHCATTPSKTLGVIGPQNTYGVNADLHLGDVYDFFFQQCMSLRADDYGFFVPNGHSIQFEQCVAEYADVDGFYINGPVDGVRMYGCYGAYNVGNGYDINCADGTIFGCRARKNFGHGFYLSGASVSLTGCRAFENDQTNKAGFCTAAVANGGTISGCWANKNYNNFEIGGNFCAVSGSEASNAYSFGVYLTGSANYNSITGNSIWGNASYGILCNGTDNTFSGNNLSFNRSGGQQCIDNGSDNVWTGNYGAGCKEPLAADLTGDCKVDFGDFALFAGEWLEDQSP